MSNQSKEYQMGYDCAINGANTTNSHFSLFSTPEKLKEWQRGREDGMKAKVINHYIEKSYN